jgi:hypothetical protein
MQEGPSTAAGAAADGVHSNICNTRSTFAASIGNICNMSEIVETLTTYV